MILANPSHVYRAATPRRASRVEKAWSLTMTAMRVSP